MIRIAAPLGIMLTMILCLGQNSQAQTCYQVNHQVVSQHYQQSYPAQKIVSPHVQGIAYAPVSVDSYPVPVQAYAAPYYYSVSEAYRDKAYLRDVIREELRALVTGGPPAATAPTPTAPQPPAAAQQPKPPAGKVVAPDDFTPPALQAKIVAAYRGRANCISCHSGASPKGDLRLVLDDGAGGYKLVKYDSPMRWKIYGMASVGAMPPSAATDSSKAMELPHLNDLLQYAAAKD